MEIECGQDVDIIDTSEEDDGKGIHQTVMANGLTLLMQKVLLLQRWLCHVQMLRNGKRLWKVSWIHKTETMCGIYVTYLKDGKQLERNGCSNESMILMVT